MKFPAFHWVVTGAMALQFVHYCGAGASTFVRHKLDDGGEEAGAVFAVAGVGVIIMARTQRIALLNGVVALALVATSLGLYEWARRTIRGRGFSLIFSGIVPESLCESGPYAYLRHPFYMSYIIGFTAALIAFPNVYSAAGWAIASVWFWFGARNDEAAISQSPLAEAYAGYRKRTGMFFPIWWK